MHKTISVSKNPLINNLQTTALEKKNIPIYTNINSGFRYGELNGITQYTLTLDLGMTVKQGRAFFYIFFQRYVHDHINGELSRKLFHRYG